MCVCVCACACACVCVCMWVGGWVGGVGVCECVCVGVCGCGGVCLYLVAVFMYVYISDAMSKAAMCDEQISNTSQTSQPLFCYFALFSIREDRTNAAPS